MTGFERFRRKKLISRKELADYMGVSVQAVGKWENGEGAPTADKMVKLSDLYGVPINDLLRTDYPESDLAQITAAVHAPEQEATACRPASS